MLSWKRSRASKASDYGISTVDLPSHQARTTSTLAYLGGHGSGKISEKRTGPWLHPESRLPGTRFLEKDENGLLFPTLALYVSSRKRQYENETADHEKTKHGEADAVVDFEANDRCIGGLLIALKESETVLKTKPSSHARRDQSMNREWLSELLEAGPEEMEGVRCADLND